MHLPSIYILESQQLFNLGQHGFRTGRSCLSQLLAHYDKALDTLEDGQNAYVVYYIVFAKVFDNCDHGVIAHKGNNWEGGKLDF